MNKKSNFHKNQNNFELLNFLQKRKSNSNKENNLRKFEETQSRNLSQGKNTKKIIKQKMKMIH